MCPSLGESTLHQTALVFGFSTLVHFMKYEVSHQALTNTRMEYLIMHLLNGADLGIPPAAVRVEPGQVLSPIYRGPGGLTRLFTVVGGGGG